MYRIMIETAGKVYPLHDIRDADMQVSGPVLDLEVGKTGRLCFSVPATHPHVDQIRPLASEIYVCQDDELIFCGRHIGKQEDFYRTGTMECEGELSYLLDSIQHPYDFKGNIPDFFRQCLNAHNSQVEKRKQFTAGNITIIDHNNYISRSNSHHSTTMETMQEKLVGTHGGYLRVRHAADKRYLDYISDYGGINSQVIRYGENLLDLSSHVDPAGIITALIPVGAELEDGTRVDITSVNGGQDYIYDQAAVDAYGWIWGTMEWEDVTLPENLLRKARAYLQECITLPVTLELSAVDMSLLNVDMEKLRLGYWTRVESQPHNISADFLLSKMHVDLENPTNNTVTLGRVLPTFTGSANRQAVEASKKVERMGVTLNKNIERAVDNATTLITGGKGGYVILDMEDENGKRSLPWRILIMDSPDKGQAKSIIQLNKNGLGFSTTGIGGPYRNAWTIDGSLVADFITAGTMYADRIRGGTLTLGGSNNDNGVLRIVNAAGKEIGSWTKDGIVAAAGKFTGNIEGSTITGGSINIKNIFVVDAAGNTSVAGSHFSWSATNSSMAKDGTLVCKGLKATGADITGKITATSGEFPARLITGKLTADHIDATSLKVDAANITGKLTADQINAANLQVDAANITGKLTADQINTANLQVNAANITGTLDVGSINTQGLRINGSQISEGSIGTSRFNSGVSNWVGGIAADKISTAELSADRIYPNNGEYIWFPRGPVLVTRLQIDGGSSITCRDGWCGTNDYPFAQGWFGSINGASARKLKKDIRNYAGGLDVVMKTEVKRYRMKKDKSGRLRYGFIAEDAPCEIATEQRQGIDLYNCIGILFSAVQELNRKMEVS